MTAAEVAETLAREYPKTVVLNDGAHLVLRASGPEAGTIVVAADDDGTRAGTARLGWATDPVDLALTLEPAYRDRRLGTWMLLDGVHLAAALGAASVVVDAPATAEAFRAALRRLDFVERDPGRFTKTLHHGWTDF